MFDYVFGFFGLVLLTLFILSKYINKKPPKSKASQPVPMKEEKIQKTLTGISMKVEVLTPEGGKTDMESTLIYWIMRHGGRVVECGGENTLYLLNLKGVFSCESGNFRIDFEVTDRNGGQVFISTVRSPSFGGVARKVVSSFASSLEKENKDDISS